MKSNLSKKAVIENSAEASISNLEKANNIQLENDQEEQYQAEQAVDQAIGKRLKQIRVFKNITQHELGKAIEVTFQQIQKYESGRNRISASVLFSLSRFLQVPIGFFFDKLLIHQPEQNNYNYAPASCSISVTTLSDNRQQDYYSNTTSEEEELLRYYMRIKNVGIRKNMFEMMKSLASQYDNYSKD